MLVHKLVNLVLALAILALGIATMITSRSDAKKFGVTVAKSKVSDVTDAVVDAVGDGLAGKFNSISGFADISRPMKHLPNLNKSAQALIVVSALMVVLVVLSMFVQHKLLNIACTLVCLATLVAGILCIVFGAMVPSTKSGKLGIASGVVVLLVVGSCGVDVSKMLRK